MACASACDTQANIPLLKAEMRHKAEMANTAAQARTGKEWRNIRFIINERSPINRTGLEKHALSLPAAMNLIDSYPQRAKPQYTPLSHQYTTMYEYS